jgi:hypothetical protein
MSLVSLSPTVNDLQYPDREYTFARYGTSLSVDRSV